MEGKQARTWMNITNGHPSRILTGLDDAANSLTTTLNQSPNKKKPENIAANTFSHKITLLVVAKNIQFVQQSLLQQNNQADDPRTFFGRKRTTHIRLITAGSPIKLGTQFFAHSDDLPLHLIQSCIIKALLVWIMILQTC